jgi:hypothetical protein
VAGTISLQGGVLGGAGLLVSPGTGMQVKVDPGHFVVPNTSRLIAGGYAATLPSQETLTVTAADPTNPRVDLVVAFVSDVGSSASFGQVAVITGTPAASPVPPVAPGNSITLARVSVPAGATSVTGGNIVGTRPFTCAVGGIPVAPRGSLLGYIGQLAFDPASVSFYHNVNGGGGVPVPIQARMLPFAPVTAVLTGGNFSLATAPAQVPGLSASVTCDGKTDLKLTYHVAGFTGLSSAVTFVTVGVYLDGALVDQTVVSLTASNSAQGGVNGVAYTGSVTGNTPSAGPHTIIVQASSSAASGGNPQLHAFSTLPASAWLRVEPVNL